MDLKLESRLNLNPDLDLNPLFSFLLKLLNFHFCPDENVLSCRALNLLESDLNEVISEFFCDGCGLLRNDGIFVQTDDECLLCLDRMNSVGSLLGADDAIRVGQEHVASSGDGHTTLSEFVGVTILRDQDLQLFRSHLKICG
jgi:hypothetical protein